uniref:Neural cell adhesion molecule 3 n=1 Tax=Gadus morhua TaxID=8049 RepID=A0A8C4ZH90_GADMO
MMHQSTLVLRMTVLLVLGQMSGTAAEMDIIYTKSDIEIGVKYMLLCKAGGEGDITWQKDGKEIDDEERVSKIDEVSSKLEIQNATLEDAGSYTCLCTFDNGDPDGRTSTNIYVYDGPSFGATQVYHEFLIGQDGMVPCLASGRPKVDVRWLRDEQVIHSQEGDRVTRLQDNSLRIKNVRKDDAGTYTCQATIRGRPIKQDKQISVVVNAPPTVTLKEKIKKVMAGADKNISLLCLVDGQPTPNISWITPVHSDLRRYQFNSDQSELTICAVSRADYGEYICTARNKIGESTGTIELHVSEAPEVYVRAKEEKVSLGSNVSLPCNVTGHPFPQLYWIHKQSRNNMDSSGRVHVRDGVLTIAEVAPSDGGLYSCMAVSASGNASRDVAVLTQPGPPQEVSVTPRATSLVFSLKSQPISGGTPISSFVLQWRRGSAEKWEEIGVPVSDPLAIPSLTPYTTYTVRLAAMNSVGLGQYSTTQEVRSQGILGEPDRPVLSSDGMKIDGNALSVPVAQLVRGSSPLLHYTVRYREEKEGAGWKEEQRPADTSVIALSDLAFGEDYRIEVKAVNANGSSIPAELSFSVSKQPAGMTKGGVVAIVMVIFLVLLLVVDATCCYTNNCGLLMFIATKVFGRKTPGHKTMEEGTNGDLNLKGLDSPRGSIHQQQSEGKLKNEITCDKAPLTKNEKHFGDIPTTEA